MKTKDHLADSSHPKIREIAFHETEGAWSDYEKVKNLFFFVRDEIPFGFPSRLEDMKASEVVTEKMGVCTSKTTLFKALLDAVGIPARVHYGAIDLQIFRGVVPGYMLWVMPKTGSHSWLEFNVDKSWESIDSYIFDKPYFTAARDKLVHEKLNQGYGLACKLGKCSERFHFGEQGFVQMEAVQKDFGVWDDPADFLASGHFQPMDKRLQALYPKMAAIVNKRISKIRNEGWVEWDPQLSGPRSLDPFIVK